MSRELKFRVWDGSRMHKAFDLSQNPIFWWEKNFDYPLMQYTGLKDKNGVEIYEGDIVRRHTGATGSVQFGKYVTNNEDDEDILGWAIELPLRWRALDPQSSYEVIGNIYENPEPVGDGDAA